MNRVDIIRAWKDADYRESLSDAERALLPESPIGLVELHTDALAGIAGGLKPVARPVTQVHCPSHRPGGCNPTHRAGCGGTVTKIFAL
jgi:mersacidin/lichenicidin family type 2 lantibiotic